MIMSTATGLEELLREKAQLKDDLQSLCKDEKHFAQKLRLVEEEIAVRELEDKIRAKHVVLNNLVSKKRNLEERVK